MVAGVPFVRNAWSYDRFHELELPLGELLLVALCASPYEPVHDSRLPLLDAVTARVPPEVLSELPAGGLTPAELHERLDGTDYAPAAEFADWLWAQTDTVFLDVDEETELDVAWTHENVRELAAQWRRAEGLLNRTGRLAGWLEAEPAGRFARLIDAALGRDARVEYERMRRYYACEITESGLVPISHDAPDEEGGEAGRGGRAVPLPLEPAD